MVLKKMITVTRLIIINIIIWDMYKYYYYYYNFNNNIIIIIIIGTINYNDTEHYYKILKL